VQLRPHRLRPQAERLRRLLDSHPVHVARDQHHSEASRQGVHRSFEPLPELAARGGALLHLPGSEG
jgi:hypothetical protein